MPAPTPRGPIVAIDEVPTENKYYDGSYNLNKISIKCALFQMNPCFSNSNCGWCGSINKCIAGNPIGPLQPCQGYRYNMGVGMQPGMGIQPGMGMQPGLGMGMQPGMNIQQPGMMMGSSINPQIINSPIIPNQGGRVPLKMTPSGSAASLIASRVNPLNSSIFVSP